MENEKLVNLDFVSSLKGMKFKFNPRPFSNPLPVSSEKFETVEESFIDHHAEVARKVDALIAEIDKETAFEEVDATPEEKMGLDPERTIFRLADSERGI